MRSATSKDNGFHDAHVRLIFESFHRQTGRALAAPVDPHSPDFAEQVFYAPFALLSHDASEDPVFTYANQTALSLFGLRFEEITQMHSRLSAEPGLREERERLLRDVRAKGYSSGYRGIRSGRKGRFEINRAAVWNLLSPEGNRVGQAAWFDQWRWLDDPDSQMDGTRDIHRQNP